MNESEPNNPSALIETLPDGVAEFLPFLANDWLPELAIAGALAWGAGIEFRSAPSRGLFL